MNCPSCGEASRVEETRKIADGQSLRRYRRCPRCRLRFSTVEELDASSRMVLKRDGSLRRFDRDKVAESIKKAAVRTIFPSELNAMVEKVVQALLADHSRQLNEEPEQDWAQTPPIAAESIGETIMQVLRSDTQHLSMLVRYALLFEPSRGTFRDASSFLQWLQATGLVKPFTPAPLAGQPVWVLKRDGTRAPFEARKLRQSIRMAMKKRPREGDETRDEEFGDQLMRRVLEAVRHQRLVTTGQLATELLRVLHPTWDGRAVTQLSPQERQLAYLRVASTAKDYTRVEDFVDEAYGLVEASEARARRVKRPS